MLFILVFIKRLPRHIINHVKILCYYDFLNFKMVFPHKNVKMADQNSLDAHLHCLPPILER